MTTPELGSIHAMWSWTATKPGVFSAMDLEGPAQPPVDDRPRKSHYSVLNLNADAPAASARRF
jgi:hypothetical protein